MTISHRLSWIYATGSAMEGAMMSILSFYSNVFMFELGMSAEAIATVIVISKFFDVINDPIIGNASDNTISAKGKRKMWMVNSILPTCLLYILLWIKPPFKGDVAMGCWFVVFFTLFDIFLSSYRINYDALTSEMTSDYDERIPLVFKRTLIFILASGAASVLHSLFFQILDADGGEHSLHAYTISAVVVVFVTMPFAFWCTWNVSDGHDGNTIWNADEWVNGPVDSFDVTVDDNSGVSQGVSFNLRRSRNVFSKAGFFYFFNCMRRDYVLIHRNKSFVLLCVVNQCIWVCVNVIQSTLIMYVKYVENETNTDFTMTVLTVQIGVVIGLLLFATVNYAGYIKCKKQALQGVIFGLIITSATLTFIRLNVVTELLFGIGISGSALLLQSMLPDVIDMGETHSVRNSRLEGSYYAVFSILQKISTGIAISIVNFVLSAHGYKSGQQETQPQSAINAISNLFAVLPILLLSLSFIPLYYYNVTSTEQRRAQNSRFVINSTNTEWIRVNDSDEPT